MPVFSRPQRPKKRRAVRWEESFKTSADAIEVGLGSDLRRLDDLTAACIWEIEEDAEECPEVPGTPFRVAKAQQVPGGRVYCVLFTIDPDDEMCGLWFVYTTDDPGADITA